MKISFKRAELNLWLGWLLAALIGRLALGLLGGLFQGSPLAAGLVSGLAVALPQWVVLRGRIQRSSLWALLTFLSVSVSAIVLSGLDASVQGFYAAIGGGSLLVTLVYFPALQALQGLFVGLFQWVVLRLEVRDALWWAPIVALASALASVFNLGFTLLVFRAYEAAGFGRFLNGLVALIAAAIYAGVSGFFLVRLLRQRVSERLEASPEALPETETS